METSIVAHLLLHICQQGNRSYGYVTKISLNVRVGACLTFLLVVHSLFFIEGKKLWQQLLSRYVYSFHFKTYVMSCNVYLWSSDSIVYRSRHKHLYLSSPPNAVVTAPPTVPGGIGGGASSTCDTHFSMVTCRLSDIFWLYDHLNLPFHFHCRWYYWYCNWRSGLISPPGTGVCWFMAWNSSLEAE